ncbi:exported hypothetical protein [metagenome]|uniref:Uncharacterized protein n=1 Tax=metagenome TaxID=256318 RepID=A0A2P2C702_9ZZZZ
MNKLQRTATATALIGAVAVPTAFVFASPASADIEKGGVCGNARYELNVDKENGGFEVDADLDNAAAGTQWRVVLRHDGTVFYNKIRTTDREGDLDVERFRTNTAGADKFRLTVKRINGSAACTTVITTR